METLLTFLLIFCVSIGLLIRRHFSYWERMNIPHIKTTFPFGILKPVVKKERSFGFVISDIYKSSKEKILGIYVVFKPYLLVRDAELARQVLTSSFGSFHDRGIYIDDEKDPLTTSLFNSEGENWHTLRSKLSPSFTSGKLKGMFGTIDDVGSKMVQYLNNELKDCPNGKFFEMKDIMTTYVVDIVASVIFGLEVDSFSNPNNEFRNFHKRFTSATDIPTRIFGFASFMSPMLGKLLTRLGYKEPVIRALRETVQRTVDFRQSNKVVRRDLLHMLIQLRSTGKISEDDDKVWNVETIAENLKAMSMDHLTSNAFLFYMAGTETTSTLTSFTLYELSMYPELLKKAQDEVEEVFQKHGIKRGDKLTYEALQDMKFLDLCMMETVRKYPGLPILNRECTQTFKVPGTKYEIKKGTPIMISLFGLHYDPKYFPELNRYNPERFLDESKDYDPTAYMPFGEGPRHCIAQRMGKLNSKLGIASILANFNIKPRELKENDFTFETLPVFDLKGGLQVHLSKKN